MPRELRLDGSTPSFGARAALDFRRNWPLYLLFLPVFAYYIIFHYWPMYGVISAFQDFNFVKGFMASPWADPWYKHFERFFSGYYAGRVISNTLLLNVYGMLFSWPLPIVFALLLNEVRLQSFKRTVQTLSYLPHFISMVVIAGMIRLFTGVNGLFNEIIGLFGGGERINFLLYPQNFRSIYIGSGIWQGLGWGSIIYIAAIAGVDQELYEAATIDGAKRLRKMWHITLPGIRPTIIILLIMAFGSMMSHGADKILLLYEPSTYVVADVISSYVYRMGLQRMDYSFGAAVGFMNSIINMLLLFTANFVSKKVSETSLW